jgi:hypothetical protein
MTVSVNVVVLVRPPPTPVTVTVYPPGGVDGEVMMTRVKEMGGVTVQVGAPPHIEPLLKLGVAPLGSPLTVSITDCVGPLTRATVIMVDPELP